MKKLLTLGIPTFNDCENIIQVLDSIKANVLELDQLDCKVEVLISDNASTDNTKQVVADYMRANPSLDIRYYRNAENIGGRANAFKVASLATGKYLWLICDDLLFPDALKNFQKEVFKHQPDMMQVAVRAFEGKIQNTIWQSVLKEKSEIIESFKGQDVCLSQFIGNLIIKTSLWREFSEDERCRNSSYPHLWIALRCFRDSKLLFAYDKLYVHERLTRRNLSVVPLRTLDETVVEVLKCINDNKRALGGTIFDTITGENHFKRVEALQIKFLWNHIVRGCDQQLKTIPLKQKIEVFFKLLQAARLRRRQVKFLAKIGFYLFRFSSEPLSSKDLEFLRLGDLSNSANAKIL